MPKPIKIGGIKKTVSKSKPLASSPSPYSGNSEVWQRIRARLERHTWEVTQIIEEVLAENGEPPQ